MTVAGFTIAGRVIEVATGQRIHDALRDLVIRPIGLPRTFTRTEEAVTHRFAAAHRTTNDALTVLRPISRSTTVTAGGVWMSLTDMLAYAKFHLGDGAGADGKPVLARSSLEQMRAPRVRKVGTDDEMGLGWHRLVIDPKEIPIVLHRPAPLASKLLQARPCQERRSCEHMADRERRRRALDCGIEPS